jgi:transporter family protein
MNEWFWYALGAAVLYGLHQIFTKLASDRIGEGLAASWLKRPLPVAS